MNYFGHVVHEILQNNYLKTNFENSEFRYLSPLFEISKGRNFPTKMPCFLTLNAHIWRTVNAGELNEAILKSSH